MSRRSKTIVLAALQLLAMNMKFKVVQVPTAEVVVSGQTCEVSHAS